MNNSLVSVVMPAYNVEQYIAESIESVIAQTYLNWELIIVDDGSTDTTAAVVKKYLNTDKRITYLYQENSKQGKAKNNAIKNSNGQYIAFLDADDLWLPEKLSVSVNEIQKGGCDLLFTNTFYFENGDGDKFSKKSEIEPATYQGKSGVLAFVEANKIPNLTVVVKKETLLAAGDFTDLLIAEEYEMWLRLLGNGAVFKAIDAPLSSYRVRNGSLTANDRMATFETMLIIKSFAQRHSDYRHQIKSLLKDKFKHWLYNGYDASNKKCRNIITYLSPYSITVPLYLLSFLLPFKYFRKVSNRTLYRP